MRSMNDKTTGGLLLAAAIGILLVYSYALFFAGSSIAILVLQITAFVVVAGILGLVGWIGYSIATTSPPTPEPEVELGGNKDKEDTTPAEPPAPQQTEKTAEKKPRKREAKPATTTAT